MRDDRVAVVERQPQVFAAPPGADDRPAGERLHEVLVTRDVPPDRALVQHLHRRDPPTDGVCVQALPDRLDLGKLGHQIAYCQTVSM